MTQVMLVILAINYVKNIFLFAIGDMKYNDTDERSWFSYLYYTEPEYHCSEYDHTIWSLLTWPRFLSQVMNSIIDGSVSIIFIL